MPRPLRVLIVEDNPADAELIARQLRRGGFDAEWKRVDTEPDYIASLGQDIDIILSDYEMPQFSGMRALELLNERNLEIPFILVSGTIGEEMAVSAMKQGAADYLLKDRMTRLGSAVTHALEQSRLRQEQRVAETKFRAVFEAAHDGIFILLDGKFVDVNRSGLELAGLNREQLVGTTLGHISATRQADGQDSSECAAEKIEAALRGVPQFFDWVIRRPDDALVGVEIHLNRFTLGGQTYLQAIVRDVSARKKAEEVLSESERRFREMLENVEMIAITLDAEGKVTFCNDFLLRKTGWNRAEVMQADWFSIFAPDQSNLRNQFLETIGTGTVPTHHENPIRTKTGELCDIVWNNTALRDAGGRIVGIASLGDDVTERRRALQRVREQAEMLDRAHEAIMVRDIHTRRITFWNRGAERLYGWTAAEAEGRDVCEIIFGDATVPDDLGEQLLRAGEWRGEDCHVSKTGRRIIVSSNATLVCDDEGRPKSALVINIDVTEQKDLEARFLRAQRMESIGTLASGVAHDLNNILSPIMMSAPLLRRDLPGEKRDEIVTAIEMSAERGAQIVKQVLAFGRGLEGDKQLLQVGNLIKELVKIMSETFPKDIRIECSPATELWPVMGDATQLHQVLLNLSVNARDAMPDGGRLRLSAVNQAFDESYASMVAEAVPGSYVLLEVSDTGSGIPPEIVERIFDPFFTTKGVGKGTGLGLSTVHGIVKSHGGFIKVLTQVGKGTTFQVYLPASPQHRGVLDSPIEHDDLPVGHGEIVLVVDDEESVRNAARTALDAFDYKTLLAADGTEALAIFAQQLDRIAVVLTDLMMPHMDGLALIRALRRMKPKLRIVASTGLGDKTELGVLRGMNVATVLHKPYGAETLLRTIHEAIHSDRQTSEDEFTLG